MSKDPIAAGIRSLMSERGLIQKAVAFRAGYTQQQFNDMLNDRKTIKATDIVPISRAIGVSEETLLLIEDYIDGKTEVPVAERDAIGRTVDYVAGRNRYIGYLDRKSVV